MNVSKTDVNVTKTDVNVNKTDKNVTKKITDFRSQSKQILSYIY